MSSSQISAARPDEGAPPSKRRARQGRLFLKQAMKGHWPVLCTSVVAALISSAGVASIPLLLGDAVDEGLIGHRWRRFAFLVTAIALIGLVQAAAAGARRWFNGVASRRVESQLRRKFHDHLLALDVAYHGNVNRGQLLSRVTSDLFQIQAVVATAPFWVGSAALAAAVAVVLILTSPLLAAVALATLPLVAVTSERFSKRVRDAISDLQRQRGLLAGVVEETISGVRAVKGFGAEPTMRDRLNASAGAVLEDALRVVRTRGRYVPVLNTVPMIELAAVNWLGGYLVLHHRLSIGMLVAFNAYLGALTGPLQSIGAYVVMLQRAIVSGYRLGSIMGQKSSLSEPAEPRPLPSGTGAVAFRGVTFGYGGGPPVLDNLDLDIAGGELVAIVGATGSGKTTVLSLLARLYDPVGGTVMLDGVALRQLSLATVRRSVAVVFEESFLFEDTIAVNLRIGRPGASEAELRWAARLARADEFIEDLPLGYSTPIGERGLSLSGGQRQRVALARALLAEPRVLVLDDATSAVDAPKELEVVRGIAEARSGRTTVIISHRPATIAVADRVLVLEGGRVVAKGSHEELLSTSPSYRKILAFDEAESVSRQR